MTTSDAMPMPNNDVPRTPPGIVAPPVQVKKANTVAPPVQRAVAEPAAPPRVVPQAKAILTPKSQPQAKPKAPSRWRAAWAAILYHLEGENALQSSFSISAIVHAVLVVLLGLWLRPIREADEFSIIVATIGDEAAPAVSVAAKASPALGAGNDYLPTELSTEVRIENPLERGNGRPVDTIVPWNFGLDDDSAKHLLNQATNNPYSNLDGRNPNARSRLIGKPGGPTRRSEMAVELGLRWLATHQRKDGSWHFDLTKGPCLGLCRNSGNVGSTTAATSMALLAFMGAGYTHREGEYREVVAAGLYHLQKKMTLTPHGGDFQDGAMYGMYAQGLSTIALCEAYVMTRDPELKKYAQSAVDFIVFAQDSKGGGWRYTPGEPGDTTVTGWQVMAIKSAYAAYLRVPSKITYGMHKFFDGVQSESGAYYGYLATGKEPTTSAVGLLCRMLLGWPREHASLLKGVRYLSDRGPSPTNLYYNYYATQVLHHYGGPEWIAWNEKLREYLVQSQSQEGHEVGSWQFEDSHESGSKGGRLYNTCMAIMTLEVYYRYLPIYSDGVEGGPR